MATVTHVIRSNYNPADREKLERETGQRTGDSSDPWQTESSFTAQRRIRAAPIFVPAVIAYDEWGAPSSTSSPPTTSEQTSTSTAEWYRTLTATSPSRGCPLRPSSAPGPVGGAREAEARPAQTVPRESTTKKDWFISKALRSEPSTKPSSPAPSLADMLVRDPPPLPSEGRYNPPVWLHIGPSNRGFCMLQRSGWSEGEGLGAHIVRRVARGKDADECASTSAKVEEDVVEVENARKIIDLTLSDSEASEDAFENNDDIQGLMRTQAHAKETHMQRSLLTPLPTILKADRLGIGLKAKTEGPYKQSKKRVTHNAAALAAHIKSAEDMRKTKALVGKGKRGFAKIHKKEEDRRKAMLSYLNE